MIRSHIARNAQDNRKYESGMNIYVRVAMCLAFHAAGCVTLLAIVATQVIELRWEKHTLAADVVPEVVA